MGDENFGDGMLIVEQARQFLPLDPDNRAICYYHFELEGLTVVEHETERTIGIVTSVQNFPTVDALEVRKLDGSTVLVSMTEGIIKAVDPAQGVIRVSGAALEEIV